MFIRSANEDEFVDGSVKIDDCFFTEYRTQCVMKHHGANHIDAIPSERLADFEMERCPPYYGIHAVMSCHNVCSYESLS